MKMKVFSLTSVLIGAGVGLTLLYRLGRSELAVNELTALVERYRQAQSIHMDALKFAAKHLPPDERIEMSTILANGIQFAMMMDNLKEQNDRTP